MNRSTIIFVVSVLIVFLIGIYYIFGLNGRPSDKAPVDLSQTQEEKIVIPDNMKVEDVKEGTGSAVKSGDTVLIHYSGYLEDGTKFDNSIDSGQPFETQIGAGSVIKGWDLGVPGMKVGGKRRLTIPPELGYGEAGAGPIPPNSTLIFDLELMGIK